jgi:steroid delta-isomerase-like uncharacterized protein
MPAQENDPTVAPTARRGRLPAGRHKLPREFVVRSQRDRLLDAIAQQCALDGYGSASVEAVCARAGIDEDLLRAVQRPRGLLGYPRGPYPGRALLTSGVVEGDHRLSRLRSNRAQLRGLYMGNPSDVAEQGLQAWRSRDVEGFAATFAEDATLRAPGGMQLRGRDGARQFYSVWNEAVPDNDIKIERRHACGSVVVEQGVFGGTHTGNLAAPGGQVIPATGRSVSVPYVEVFDIEGDQVASTRLYFDQAELLTQLGLMPAPEGAAAS